MLENDRHRLLDSVADELCGVAAKKRDCGDRARDRERFSADSRRKPGDRNRIDQERDTEDDVERHVKNEQDQRRDVCAV